MTQGGSQPLSARLSWDEVHRLELRMRTRAFAMSPRGAGKGATCPACGAPLGENGMRVAGIRVHPCCLPGAPTD